MPETPPYLMIVNPIAGRGRGRAAAKAALRELSLRDRTVEVKETSGRGDAEAFARSTPGHIAAVLVTGGDGTLNEVIAGAPDGMPIGLIPAGTANMVARELRIPTRPREAARRLIGFQPRLLDLASANGRRFLGCAGVGIDAEVVHRLAARRKGGIRITSYVAPTLKALVRFRAPELSITVDGKVLDGVFSGVIVCNTRNYGAWFTITPDARPDDGILDLAARRRFTRRHVISFALGALIGIRAGRRTALYLQGRSIRIESASPAPLQVDGDPAGTTPVEIAMIGRQARILAPCDRGAGDD